MGPLVVQGTTGVIRRRGVLRCLIVLSLNLGRPISTEQLRTQLAQSDEEEPTASSVRSELSRLRGVLVDGVLPDREPGLGYGFAVGDVEVDWATFDRLARQAEESTDSGHRIELGLQALDRVRGPVLVHQSWHGIDPVVWEINARIESLAATIATTALEADLPMLGASAARQGLLAVPASPRLWRLRIDAAIAGSGENDKEIAERAAAALGYTP